MPTLPAPDTEGVYTFPTDLIAAHLAWQEQLTRRAAKPPVLYVTAPHSGRRSLIEERRPTGRPVVVIEPHHDDFALSASGYFLTTPRPLTVVTVFTTSSTVDPALKAKYPTAKDVSALRAREGAATLRAFGGRQHLLNYQDAARPYRAYDKARLDEITHNLAAVQAEYDGAELLAPAAVTRHPDHLLVHEAARQLGCRWFFEDLAFWSTYALSGCDQQLFRTRTGTSLVPELTDITNVVLDKLTLLHLHGSQIQPVSKMHKPIRHAWTVAADLLDNAAGPRFAERFYRLEAS
ncbi:PIG-L deacetylase family protein [Streptomyces turgidiscabies]|uniref:PIG-L deacetylase family protein n=1 Tax=Streptomyces turgidiscabies TaxID=85558 RepID=UPI0038F5EE84